MIKLDIAGKKYKYRSKQSEISYVLGHELEILRAEYPCDCDLQFQRWCLTLLCGCSFDEAMLVKDEQIALLIGTHPFFDNQIKIGLPRYIKVQKKLYKFNCDIMSVYRYTELDDLANDEQFLELYKSLYQLVKGCHVKSLLRHILCKNHKQWQDCNYFRVKLAIYQYFQWKQKLMKEYYLSAFDERMGAEQQPDEVKLTPVEKFGMFHIVMQVSDNDYDKYMAWQDRDIRALFKYILYLKRKQESQ